MNTAWVDKDGRGSVWFTAKWTGRHTYRLRVHHVNVTSRTFVMTMKP
ncbi:hypothetical protein [Gephyromycinifex aptenodytis]|nr:hypothetical protein [Gephyromycinifex aptenodytis]